MMFFNVSTSNNNSYTSTIDPGQKVFFVVLLALESTFGTFANFIIILVICSSPFLRTVENAFVVNLALADFLISFVTQPSSLAGVVVGKAWFVNHPRLCGVIGQLCSASCLATNWNTLLIAANRYILICQPYLYPKMYNRLNVFFMCLFAWFFMFLIGLPNHVGWGKFGFSNTLFVCTFASDNYPYTMFVMASSLFLPASVTFSAYYGIHRKVMLSRNRVRLATHLMSLQDRGAAFRRNVKIAKGLFKAYIIYLVLVLPFGIVMVLGMGEKMPHIWYMLSLLLFHGVGTTNCFVYAARLGKFWDGFKLFFRLPRKDNLVIPSVQLSTSSQRSNRTSGKVLS